MIEEFLTEDPLLELTIVIVDGRHRPSKLDALMVGWLLRHQIPAQVVATKIDKVAKSKRPGALAEIGEVLGVEKVVPFSAVTREGKKEIWRIIQNKR
jgi:GTP-binding protein